MATEVGIETFPSDGPWDAPGGLPGWMRSMGATIVKIRSDGYASQANRDKDCAQVRSIAANGLKIVTRPGGLHDGDCGEGVPLWNGTDVSTCCRRNIDRFYDVILNCVVNAGYGGWDRWYAHILANEPNKTATYGSGSAVATYKDHLKAVARKIVEHGWTWIPFVTPPMCWTYGDPYNAQGFYNATVQAFSEEPAMAQAFKYFGFHIYWGDDGFRDSLMTSAQNYAAAAGKRLFVAESNVDPAQMNTCYDGTHCLRHASHRHMFYTLRNNAAALIIFLLTGGQEGWSEYNLGDCSGCTNQVKDYTYQWVMEPGRWA